MLSRSYVQMHSRTHCTREYGAYVAFATKRELFLRKLERRLDGALADEFDQLLLAKLEHQARIRIQNLKKI